MIAVVCHSDSALELLAPEAGLQDGQGLTALHYAVLYRNISALPPLARVLHIQTHAGLSPLMFAVLNRDQHFVELLYKQNSKL